MVVVGASLVVVVSARVVDASVAGADASVVVATVSEEATVESLVSSLPPEQAPTSSAAVVSIGRARRIARS